MKRMREVAEFHTNFNFAFLEDGEERFLDDEIFEYYPVAKSYYVDWRKYNPEKDNKFCNGNEITRRLHNRSVLSLLDERGLKLERDVSSLAFKLESIISNHCRK